MSSAPLLPAGPAGHAANENAGAPSTLRLAPQARTKAECDPHRTTVFHVTVGVVEFMVNGAAGSVMTGGTVSIPPGVTHACRNIGDTVAILTCHRRPAGPPSGGDLL